MDKETEIKTRSVKKKIFSNDNTRANDELI